MATNLLDNLNPAQRRAVEVKDGPVLVIAGPGSGKTRVLTSRVAYLLEVKDVYPYRIMAVTFTNKAAREMRERLNRIVGAARTADLMMGTFHSICARILRREAPSIGVDRDFTIYDADDQLNVVKAALNLLNLDDKQYKPGAMQHAISTAKNELLGPQDMKADTYYNEVARRVYEKYNAILRTNNALDFDDLLMETVRLLKSNEQVCEKMQDRYLHVLVDEFQDTNISQYTLVNLIAAKHRNLFCVGDPDQSIYKWRGADYRNVKRLQDDHPDLQLVALDQNYRSTQTILDSALAVIKKNPNRSHIKLFTEKGQGPKVVVRELFSADEEAQYVIDTIHELVHQNAAQAGDCAVMYRTNAQSRAIEDAFIRAGMPYKLVGATRFYARKEIKDVLAYLRIVNNPADFISLQRVISVPPRGIGDKSVAILDETARANGISPYEVLKQGKLTGRSAKALTEFSALWQLWVRLRDELTIGQLFDRIVETSGYREFISDNTEEGNERWANVLELREVAMTAGDAPLSSFLNDIALVSESDNLEETTNAPVMLTLHAAKGLEFRCVFIVGLEDGILPHSRSFDDPEEMAEERRLLYVGITRAKERLYLLRAFRRSSRGLSDMAAPSRFLEDLPLALLDGKPRKNIEVQADVTSWKMSAPAPLSSYNRATEFRAGERVYHQRFGEGIVQRSIRQRDDEEVEVTFDDGRSRLLSASISGLKKIE
ncbi:MAG TPA: UvrD-helicase domain-containing protein [Anaerolineae bacterium]|jgi:DNA helicase-2/ATP-dependent DNA helicase PcrA